MFLNKIVKATALSVGLSLSLAASQTRAATVISFVGGGSSALQGNFQFSPADFTNSYSPGAIPQAIGAIGAIGAYKSALQAEHLILVRSVNPSGDGVYVGTAPNGAFKKYTLTGAATATTTPVSPDDLVVQTGPGQYEVVNDAQIRTTVSGADTHVLILLRSDSGQGVRYVANRAKIVQLPATLGTRFARVSPDAPAAGPFTTATVSDAGDQQVITDLKTASSSANGIAIGTGFSDVTADSVIRYAGFGANAFGTSSATPVFNSITNPPAAFNTKGVAVQTLLLLYNKNVVAGDNFAVNLPRHLAQNITAGFAGASGAGPITWKNVDTRLNANPIKSAFRENTSGTRITYVVDILRHSLVSGDYLSENIGGKTLAPTANPQLGTGTMINTVNNNTDAFGYAFVTGGAGNSKPNIRVAAYEGVLPYASSNAAVSLPNNNGQTSYASFVTANSAPYYTATVSGQYPLWAVANAFTTKKTPATPDTDADVLNSILSAFANNPSIPYNQGFALVDDLNNAGTFRDQFQSPITQEFVTDGLEINFDGGNGTSLPSPVVQ